MLDVRVEVVKLGGTLKHFLFQYCRWLSHLLGDVLKELFIRHKLMLLIVYFILLNADFARAVLRLIRTQQRDEVYVGLRIQLKRCPWTQHGKLPLSLSGILYLFICYKVTIAL